MKLVIALGNPGEQYAHTRHNAGWMMLDALDLDWQEKPRFHAYLAEQGSGEEKVIYAKPTTFYNESGRTARALLDFYKLSNSDILVIADDLALPLGTIRTRIGGSGGGNNGIASLNAAIGEDYARIRIGTGSEMRDRIDDTDFVLGNFNFDEMEHLQLLQADITKLLHSFVYDKLPISTSTQTI